MLGHILGGIIAFGLIFLTIETLCPEWLRKKDKK